ncbi:MAG: 2-C-methyl-D-erythritol 4-phosphate cytidylyltransferase [Solirubrobacteraceae bacterium]|jgi:2-C-methyl-D-erythritol 4-phosphate cytidylyltransferase|nr:2-C-methyl-D-erythritol 4-phosphate cytidylyltransferase [Solirubrobacteraceae bacterium]
MTIALIVAAGSGERLGADRPKALVELAGRPMLQWSIDALAAMQEVRQIVVALPPGAQAPAGVLGVEGGATRSDSVRRALAAAADGDPVIVHDAARPLLTPALAREVTGALGRDAQAAAAIAAAPVSDTIKRADDGGAVSETLARAGLWAVQTPQVFRRAALERALDVSEELLADATDDAWLVERSGARVIVVNVGSGNLKVTTPLDLEMAAMLLARRPPERA